jgi:plastocyanin
MRLIVPVLFVALLTAGCSGSGNRVGMVDGQAFDPETLTVAPGATVAFVNESEEAHTVTAYEDELPDGAPYFASGGFDSEPAAREGVGDGLVPSGETYEVTFDEPGTYRYFCIPHEGEPMRGTIVVEE